MSDDDGGGVTRSAVLSALGIGGGVWASIAAFGEELAEAESFRELVVEIILTQIVGGVLSLASYLFSETLFAIDLIAESFWASLVLPFGELYRSFTELIISPLEAIRSSVEAGVASTGLAAPFVALAGWVSVLLVAAVVIGIIWAVAETYLPTEAITENLMRALSLALAPLRIVGRLLRGAWRVVRGERTEGGEDDS